MKQISIFFASALICTALAGAGCGKQPVSTNDQNTTTTSDKTSEPANNDKLAQDTALSNPATVYCLEQGGKFTMSKTLDGSTEGLCILPSNITCEEWAFYRGDCPTGSKKKVAETTVATEPAIATTTESAKTETDLKPDNATDTSEGQAEEAEVGSGYGAMGKDEQPADSELGLVAELGEEPGEIVTSWKTNGLQAPDGFIVMLSGQEQISHPTKYAHVLKNTQSRSFVWNDLVAGRKYYFRVCIAEGETCGTYSEVVSQTAE